MMNCLGGENILKDTGATIIKEKMAVNIRRPDLSDGAAVWELIKNTKILDVNSSYSYLLWCRNFSETTVVIEANDEIIGFISGFINPAAPNRLFIWQVAVAEVGRGQGLATKMLHHLLEREACEDVQYIETTISPSNIPSQKLFRRLARDLKTDVQVSEYFVSDDFPEDGHEDELLHEIGPFKKS